MGTSASKGDPAPGFPLVPPWANQDNVIPPDETDEPGDANDGTDADQSGGEQIPLLAPSPPAPSIPFRRFRGRLNRYVDTGDRNDARSAIGSWVNTSRGGARFATQRLSRAGLPADIAVDRIVDAYCPPGILDEDALRAALGEALAELVAEADTFDPAAVDENAVRVAMLRFVAELVFVSVTLDSGDAFTGAAPTVAIQRENDLRALIREVTDVVGSPLLPVAGEALSTAGVRDLISRVVLAVHAEMATGE